MWKLAGASTGAIIAALKLTHTYTSYASPQPLVPRFAPDLFAENPNQQQEEEENKVLKDIVEEHRFRLLIEYENKIRFFSQPEKVFDYFGSVELDGERFMTRQDLILALTPSMQRAATAEDTQKKENKDMSFFELLLASTKAPGASGSVTGGFTQISVEQYKQMKQSPQPHRSSSGKRSPLDLMDASGDGLISFDEFMLCRTFLSISSKDVRVAFDIFDANGNGVVDNKEFEDMMERFRKRSDAARGSLLKKGSVSADCGHLLDHFFGKERNGTLKFEQFFAFVEGLQNQVLELEFQLKLDSQSNEEDKPATSISIEDFVELVVSHVPRADKLVEKLKGRLILERDVTLADWLLFNKFVKALCEGERSFFKICLHKGDRKIKFSKFVDISRALRGKERAVPQELLAAVFMVAGSSFDEDPEVDVRALFDLLKGRADRFRNAHGNAEIARQMKCGWKCVKYVD
jgi:Ca2+-binding EF-hand superfamily protein